MPREKALAIRTTDAPPTFIYMLPSEQQIEFLKHDAVVTVELQMESRRSSLLVTIFAAALVPPLSFLPRILPNWSWILFRSWAAPPSGWQERISTRGSSGASSGGRSSGAIRGTREFCRTRSTTANEGGCRCRNRFAAEAWRHDSSLVCDRRGSRSGDRGGVSPPSHRSQNTGTPSAGVFSSRSTC
jgi:hypothetical protein